MFALSVEGKKSCAVQSLRHAGLHEQVCVTSNQAFLASARRCSPSKRTLTLQRAASQDANGADTSGDFNLTEYVEAKVERGKETVCSCLSEFCWLSRNNFTFCTVDTTDKNASVLLLKVLDGRGNILPVYVGESPEITLLECSLATTLLDLCVTHR